MNFAIKGILLLCLLLSASVFAQGNAYVEILKKQVKDSGFVTSVKLYNNPDEKLSAVGKTIFESKGLSLNGDIACKTCHLEKFGSSDGIPVAAAIGGAGEGPSRLKSGAKLLARNTLALWGVGARGFKVFFWDGRVEFTANKKMSPFGSTPPSSDPLVTAVHLPVAEIREMLDEDKFVVQYKKESAKGAAAVYQAIADNLRRAEPNASSKLAEYLKKLVIDLAYIDYARAIAAFIRSEFRIRPTKLEQFVEGTGKLSEDEIRGGIIFYGKGGCSGCHSGPLFSDFRHHVVPFPQMGFGKSGFGIDYGRYEATFEPSDLYKFRTPSLYNVEKTAPYGHSGSVFKLADAVIAHYDPLALVDISRIDNLTRHELFKRMTLSAETGRAVGYLTRDEVSQVVAFLGTLSF